MYTAKQTYDRLHSVSSNYASFQNQFDNFYKSSTRLSETSFPLAGVVFEEITPRRQFRASWCGRQLEFRFSIALTEENSMVGIITCVELDPCNDQKVNREVERFTFKRNGYLTGIERPADIEDDLEVGYDLAEFYIVCRCFERTLSK